MKCDFCNAKSVKINIIETRTGVGVTRRTEHVCALHVGLGLGNYDRPEVAGLIPLGNGNYRAKDFTKGPNRV